MPGGVHPYIKKGGYSLYCGDGEAKQFQDLTYLHLSETDTLENQIWLCFTCYSVKT